MSHDIEMNSKLYNSLESINDADADADTELDTESDTESNYKLSIDSFPIQEKTISELLSSIKLDEKNINQNPNKIDMSFVEPIDNDNDNDNVNDNVNIIDMIDTNCIPELEPVLCHRIQNDKSRTNLSIFFSDIFDSIYDKFNFGPPRLIPYRTYTYDEFNILQIQTYNVGITLGITLGAIAGINYSIKQFDNKKILIFLGSMYLTNFAMYKMDLYLYKNRKNK